MILLFFLYRIFFPIFVDLSAFYVHFEGCASLFQFWNREFSWANPLRIRKTSDTINLPGSRVPFRTFFPSWIPKSFFISKAKQKKEFPADFVSAVCQVFRLRNILKMVNLKYREIFPEFQFLYFLFYFVPFLDVIVFVKIPWY